MGLDGIAPSSHDHSGITGAPGPAQPAGKKAAMKYKITSHRELEELEKELKASHKFYTQKPLNLLASGKAYEIVTAGLAAGTARADSHGTADVL